MSAVETTPETTDLGGLDLSDPFCHLVDSPGNNEWSCGCGHGAPGGCTVWDYAWHGERVCRCGKVICPDCVSAETTA